MSVFVDSSVWFAAANMRDRYNQRAKQILTESSGRWTTDHVIVETWLLLNSRVSRHAAEGFWRGIKEVSDIENVSVADVEAGWAITERFADQTFSIVDRTSFCRHGAAWHHPRRQFRQGLCDLPLREQPGSGVRGAALAPQRAANPL